MAKGVVEKSYLENIAKSIRDGNGTNNKYKPSQMQRAIYDITYHIVPVQIVEVSEGGGIYSTKIRIVNDKPTEYPNLLYTTTLSEATFTQTQTGFKIKTSKITNILDSPHGNLIYTFYGTQNDENNMEGVVILNYDIRDLGQTYAVYGKRKG